jgi:hypothetical protein
MEMGMNRRLARTISTECDTWFDNLHLVDISNEAKMTMLASEAWENLIGLGSPYQRVVRDSRGLSLPVFSGGMI